MKLGVIFPQTEIGADPVVIRDFAQAVEDLGVDHLVTYDHVLGAATSNRPGWIGAYAQPDMFHEPFVLFGYLAACTRRIELVTGILILPQRQTALVAKQAAEVDVLSGGRLRLGVGVGWNSVEYEALGMDFHKRGARMDEQIRLLRALWTQPSVSFQGRFDRIPDAGINPLPVQRPIPIWLGGESDAVIRRVAKLGDGWFPGGGLMTPYLRHERINRKDQLDTLREYLAAEGRDPASVGIEGRLAVANTTPDDWRRGADEWRAMGATHLSLGTMRAGLATPQAHIDAIRRFRETLKG
jgi:probable F420-dependent oxidoreductase